VALADIIAKIESDAAEEAAGIVAVAEEQAATRLADARSKAEAHTAEVLQAAATAAKREADTVVVNARLHARDAEVTARRALVEEALHAAAEAIAQLPDDRYAAFLASRIAGAAKGGESLSLGSEDAERATRVSAALSALAPDLSLVVSDTPAPFLRGALLTGDRVRVDLSLDAIVEERRDELEMIVARALFGQGA